MNNTIRISIALVCAALMINSGFAEESIQNSLFTGERVALEANFSGTAVNQAPSFNRSGTVSAGPFLSSLLIPGWGQYKQDRTDKALIFFGFEAVMWGGIFATRAYSKSLAQDYRVYAEVHAGINSDGKNHDYFVDIGNYDSMTQFNEVQQLERDYDSIYSGDNYEWSWDSENNRNTFEDLRIQSDRFKHNAVYFAGAIVVNHLVSAIDAARFNRLNQNLKAGIDFSPQGTGMLTIIKGF